MHKIINKDIIFSKEKKYFFKCDNFRYKYTSHVKYK